MSKLEMKDKSPRSGKYDVRVYALRGKPLRIVEMDFFQDRVNDRVVVNAFIGERNFPLMHVDRKGVEIYEQKVQKLVQAINGDDDGENDELD